MKAVSSAEDSNSSGDEDLLEVVQQRGLEARKSLVASGGSDSDSLMNRDSPPLLQEKERRVQEPRHDICSAKRVEKYTTEDDLVQVTMTGKTVDPLASEGTAATVVLQIGDESLDDVPGAYAQAGPPPTGADSNGDVLSVTSAMDSDGTDGHQNTRSEARGALIEASAIHEIPLDNLERAEPVQEIPTGEEELETGSREKTKYSLLTPCLALVLVVIVVAVVVTAVLITQNGGEQTVPTASPTSSSSSSPEEYLLMRLPKLNNNSSAWEHQNNSSEYFAFQWLVQDPSLYNYSNFRLQQRFALAAIYYASSGDSWTHKDNWLSYDHHECNWYMADTSYAWYAIETASSPCNNNSDHYERLWLANNNMQGTLPEKLYWLTSLQSIDLSTNELYQGDPENRQCLLGGTLSTNLRQLSHLTRLGLSLCQFSGTLPTTLGMLSQLSILYLGGGVTHGNRLTGTLPTEVGLLRSLSQVTLNYNAMTGTLPTELGLLHGNLSIVGLPANQFTGSLPTELGLLTKLQYLQLYSNNLSGHIPPELGQQWEQISWLHLHDNYLTGPLPTELGQMTLLQELSLADNGLTSTIPSELGLLSSSLYMLFLAQNNLSGDIPVELLNLSQLEAFDISENKILNDSASNSLLQTEPLRSAQNLTYEEFLACGQWFRCLKMQQ